jgi:uncharacterized protein YfaS (alpha-2-macroglobulin family)
MRDGKAYGLMPHPGQGYHFAALDCATGKAIFTHPVEGYNAAPTVRAMPRCFGNLLVVQVQDRQDFGIEVLNLTTGQRVGRQQQKGTGEFGVLGRVSATAQDGRLVMRRRAVTVVFDYANGEEIARQRHKANDWGSFSGSFTAPRDRLAGQMTISVKQGAEGSTSVQVEEYKRPKFQVTLDAPQEAAKLNERVEMKGKAAAYTGAAVGGAKVKWRVTRGVEYPDWWGWFCRWAVPYGETREIARGTAVTKSDGSFDLAFTARPDLAVDPKDEPAFHFEVTADVTDAAGETRSAQKTVRAGSTALAATLTADEWQAAGKPVAIFVNTTTLDGDGQAAEGTLRVHALKQPATVTRAKLEDWENPSDPSDRTDPSDPNSWDLGAVAAEQPFRTGADGTVTNTFDLGAGVYRVLLETQDRFGKKVSARLPCRWPTSRPRSSPSRFPAAW